MAVPENIERLVERFERNVEAYRSEGYNEAQLRQEFVDPFFSALGWDMDNAAGYAEAYKAVIHEDSLKIGGSTKAPDYCFRIGGNRKFFLEAKKPAVDIQHDVHPAYQLRRYAWSAKLGLSILTDFEEFAVYDCRIRPDKNDKPSVGRTLYLKYTEYVSRWDEIAGVFSHDAVLKGAFDKYAESAKRKKGTAEVDEAFLAEIELWRDELARNLALRNPELSNRQLNFAVQMTIDRIIFLRICEDRGVEAYGQLQGLLNGERVYPRLLDLFRKADDRYNSGLFHFTQEKDRPETPDELTLGLDIDDKTLKDIFRRLYYPESPYEFAVLPVEILGQVYEQFLGKVITLTAGHRARVEEKPEVRKAGGVYYTPSYIVDYIVQNTVGRLVEGKTPKQVENIKIVDPACGSGSFLLGAYQYLLDWHLKYYTENGPGDWLKKKNPPICQTTAALRKKREENLKSEISNLKKEEGRPHGLRAHPTIESKMAGGLKLTTYERKRILLNNIYGVDIDTQAVEVTKLSLLLKVLEHERELVLFHRERALPDLAANIKCGNSLIGSDFYEHEQLTMFDDEEKQRINAFDWEREFPGVFKNVSRQGAKIAKEEGGFDAVIGNPPYGATLDQISKDYLNFKYPCVSDYETSQYFLVKAEKLVRKSGYLSFIVPNTLFLNVFAKKFRSFLCESFLVSSITDLSDINVFEAANVRTTIPILIKDTKKEKNTVEFFRPDSDLNYKSINKIKQGKLSVNDSLWLSSLEDQDSLKIKEKIISSSITLNDLLEVSQGLIPYDKYRGHDEYTIKNRIWHSDHKKDDTYKKELRGGDVKRYFLRWNGKQWISYGDWLAAPRKPKYFTQPRILFREITDPKTGLLHVAYTEEEFYNNPGIINCISRNMQYSLLYILGVTNSHLLSFYHFKFSPKSKKGIFPKILVNDVRNLPIRAIDLKNKKEKSLHDKMVMLVDGMLGLHEKLGKVRTPGEKTGLERQIEMTDGQIDKLVYELYGLTEEEIGIVEGEKQR